MLKTISLTVAFGVVACFALGCGTAAAATVSANAVNGGLEQALRDALQKNPGVAGKTAELNAQRYAVNVSEAARLPSVSVTENNLNRYYGNQGTFSMQEPLWAFGKIDTAIGVAKAGYVVQQWDLLQVQRKLIEDTAVAYAKVDGDRAKIDVATGSIQEQQKLFDRIARREQGQLASEADVRLARSRLIQAKTTKQRIEGQLQVDLTQLQNLTQAPTTAGQAIEPGIFKLSGDPMQLALANSAQIGYKRQKLAVARINLKKEKIADMPTIYLRGEYDFGDLSRNLDSRRIGVTVQSNLDGLGFARHGRIEGAYAQIDVAQQDLNVSLQSVRQNIKELIVNRDTQLELIGSQKEAVKAVEGTLQSFIRQYETGRKSWIDVLNMEQEVTNLRFQLEQMQNDWLIYSLRLAAETGRLDTVAGIKEP